MQLIQPTSTQVYPDLPIYRASPSFFISTPINKGGLRQVGPVRELLHGLGAETRAIKHHGQRVAAIGLVGENVNLLEGALVHGGVMVGG